MSEQLDRALMQALEPFLTPSSHVLNVPSGDGDLSRQIEEAGAIVTSCDLFPEFSQYKRDEVIRADMNEHLPFSDDSFDVIVCQEGIEHLENLASFFRECRRVLKDGGTLLVSTPNSMDLSSRLSNFLTGLKGFRGHFPNEESTIWGMDGERFYHGHAFALPFFQIRYLMRLSQFADIELTGITVSGTARFFYWIMWPFMGPFLRFCLHRRTKKDRREDRPAVSPQLEGELEHFALSRDLLVSRKILLRAVLREGSFRCQTPLRRTLGAR